MEYRLVNYSRSLQKSDINETLDFVVKFQYSILDTLQNQKSDNARVAVLDIKVYCL
jgi:hypothetical protein